MGRKRTWEEASLDSAIDELRGGASEKDVALRTKIPRSTLRRALADRQSVVEE